MRDVGREAGKAIEERGIRVMDRSGRKWQPRAYANMAVRTGVVDTHNAGNLAVAEQLGSPGVRVSDGGPGDVDEPCIIANGQHWSLAYANTHRLEHPNCRRAFAALPSYWAGEFDRGGDEPEPSEDARVEQPMDTTSTDIAPGEYEKLNTNPDWIAQTEKKPYYHATADIEIAWEIEDNGFAGNDVWGMEGVVFLSDEPLGGFEQGLDATPGWVEVQLPTQWQPAGKYEGSEWDDEQYGTDNVAFPAWLLNLLPRRAMDAADLGASGHKVKTEHLED